MPVAYSQTRSIARARIARADVMSQVEDMLAEPFIIADEEAAAVEYEAMLAEEYADAWHDAICEDEDRAYFAKHGEWPDWAFIEWCAKQDEIRDYYHTIPTYDEAWAEALCDDEVWESHRRLWRYVDGETPLPTTFKVRVYQVT